MISPPSGTRIWLVASLTDLRKGVDGLSALVQHQLQESPFTGELYIFRGKSGDKIKVLWAAREASPLEVWPILGSPRGRRTIAADTGGAQSRGGRGRAREAGGQRDTRGKRGAKRPAECSPGAPQEAA